MGPRFGISTNNGIDSPDTAGTVIATALIMGLTPEELFFLTLANLLNMILP